MYIFFYFILNLDTPSTRPMALTDITVQTMKIQNDRLHEVDDKNKTLDEKKKQMHKCVQVV